jgi:hypothetical protein
MIVLALLGSLTWAGTAAAREIDFPGILLEFTEPADGAGVIVATAQSSGLEGTGITFSIPPASPESARVDIFIPNFSFELPRRIVAAMVEPDNLQAVSEMLFASAMVSAPTPGGAPSTIFSFEFVSDDGGPIVTGDLPPQTSVVVEDGTLQNIFVSLGLPGCGCLLVVRAQSDGENVPEPGTLLLLGSGLVGIGVIWRKRRIP